MSDPDKVCLRHRSPWPCKIDNSECEPETHPKLVRAILKLYKQFGLEK